MKRKAFIDGMVQNGYEYEPKEQVLTKQKFADDDNLFTVIYLRQPFRGKEHVNIRIWPKTEYAQDIPIARQHNFVPYENVVLLLALIKDMYLWWGEE
jgi:hypothetical protein